jgi:hypothetical protein
MQRWWSAPSRKQTKPSRAESRLSRVADKRRRQGEGEGGEAKQRTTNNHLPAICRGGRRRPILRSIANRR